MKNFDILMTKIFMILTTKIFKILTTIIFEMLTTRISKQIVGFISLLGQIRGPNNPIFGGCIFVIFLKIVPK